MTVRQFDDYGVRTAEASQRLAEFEKRPAKEILNHLLLPPADLLFLREVSSDAEGGNLPLDHTARVIDGTRKVLLSLAHSVLVPQPYHPRMSRGEAEDFLSRCRLGQTGRGSFVLTVACPLGLKADLLGPNGEPFSRRVTSLLMQSCEPTTHRFVRRAFHPTPHHPLECRPEPTPSTPARGGSGLHCRSGASRASSTGGRWSGSAARVLPPICEVSRVVTGTDAGNGGTGANERPSVANSNCLCHQSKRCAVGPRRQKRSDALSEKTKRCAVGSHNR